MSIPRPGDATDVLSGLKSPAEVAGQRKLKPKLIVRWKHTALQGPESLFHGGEQGDQARATAYQLVQR
jgi:hypothetical protein